MTINPTGLVGGLTQSQNSDAIPQKDLGKDDFLKLLVTQLQNQDPLQPMQNTEFVAQLAQFSSLEQLTNMNEQISLVQLAQLSTSNIQAAGLVGQEVTAEGDTFSYDGIGGEDLVFNLAKPAAGGEVTIYDEYGGRVQTIEFGPQEQGEVSLNWDGRTDSGTMAGAGRYRMEVKAHDHDDNPVEANTFFTGTVTGIFFDGGLSELEVEGSRVRLGEIVSISRPSTSDDGGPAADGREE
jgi:flagellar basal-body rod modification protein FlgD